MCDVAPHVPIIIYQAHNLCTSHTLVEALIFLMALNFDKKGLTPWLLTQNPSYSVSVHPNTDFFTFTLNTTSASFCETFSNAFRSSEKDFLVVNSNPYMYTRTVSNPSKSLDIVS